MDLHTDGSILATGCDLWLIIHCIININIIYCYYIYYRGLDSHIFLWDLRSGKRIAVFSGHVSGIYSLSFCKDVQPPS